MLYFRRILGVLLLGAAAVGLLMNTPVALAQVAVSANDNKLVLVNGVGTVAQKPAPDTVAIIDLKQFPPKVIAEIEAPTSVVGPPLSVAITPDESLALVTAAMKIDPNDATKQIPDHRLSVIDLKASPPAVIATLETGKGPGGLSINRTRRSAHRSLVAGSHFHPRQSVCAGPEHGGKRHHGVQARWRQA